MGEKTKYIRFAPKQEHKKKSSTKAVKTNTFVKEEAKLCEKYGAEVKVRGRSVTFSAKNEEEFRELLKKF